MLASDTTALIFHQQNNLANMLIAVVMRKIISGNQRIIYDMHDLLEFPSNRLTPKKITFFLIAWVLERLTFAIRIPIMTVSPEISEIIKKKCNQTVRTVMNMTSLRPILRPERRDAPNNKNTIVYFGVINEERLNFDDIRKVIDDGFSLDVFGTFSTEKAEQDFHNFASSNKNVRYLGPYNGQDIHKSLDGYTLSWMAFKSHRQNIHYCLPNKLFQSLSAGIPCIVDNSMISAKRLGEVGLPIVTLERLKKFEIRKDTCPRILEKLERDNRQEYLSIIEG